MKENLNALSRRSLFCASFTVEAALLMPIVIILLVWVLHLTIGLYGQTSKTAEHFEQVVELDSLKLFRDASWVREMIS